MEGAFVALVERLVVAEEKQVEAKGRQLECEERVAAALERLSEGWANAEQRIVATRDRETPKERAVRLLIQMGVKNVTAVAKAVGVTRKTLYNWPETRSLMERLRAVEAWEAREPRAVRAEEL